MSSEPRSQGQNGPSILNEVALIREFILISLTKQNNLCYITCSRLCHSDLYIAKAPITKTNARPAPTQLFMPTFAMHFPR